VKQGEKSSEEEMNKNKKEKKKRSRREEETRVFITYAMEREVGSDFERKGMKRENVLITNEVLELLKMNSKVV